MIKEETLSQILCEFKLYASSFIQTMEVSQKGYVFRLKEDSSRVTLADQAFSDWWKETQTKTFPEVHFVSEELDSSVHFPSFVLDPIDGTKEFSMGLRECVVSLAYLNSSSLDDPSNMGWLWGPLSHYECSEISQGSLRESNYNVSEGRLLGLVSRTDHAKGCFEETDQSKVDLIPRGSIAFKLGLLADGACDFVFSQTPKNLWDIAAGSIICRRRGLKLYSLNNEIEDFLSMKIDGPLLWCHPEHYDFLSKVLF